MTDKFILHENKISESEFFSPSKKYKLLISEYKTKENSWNYTQGVIIRVATNITIAKINRNYSQFNYSFLTKGDTEWLQVGESYMAQTFVNLETGQIFDNLEKLKLTKQFQQGLSFCWDKSWLSPDGNTLAVDGCYWAHEFEFQFFDFTDPATGWPEIKYTGNIELIYNCALKPHWNPDNTFSIFNGTEHIKYGDNYIDITLDEDYDKIPDEIKNIESNLVTLQDEEIILRRDNNQIIISSHTMNQKTQAWRQQSQEYQKQIELENNKLKQDSQIYQKLSELLGNSYNKFEFFNYPNNIKCFDINLENYNWWKEDKPEPHKSCNICWGISEGPIQLYFEIKKNRVKELTYPQSLESLPQIISEITSFFV